MLSTVVFEGRKDAHLNELNILIFSFEKKKYLRSLENSIQSFNLSIMKGLTYTWM